jgi:hypothetical protein
MCFEVRVIGVIESEQVEKAKTTENDRLIALVGALV